MMKHIKIKKIAALLLALGLILLTISLAVNILVSLLQRRLSR